jgi:hypothetical protein
MAIHLSLLPQRKPWPEQAAWFRFRLSVDCIIATFEWQPDSPPCRTIKEDKNETVSAEAKFACWTSWSCKTAVSHTLAVLLCYWPVAPESAFRKVFRVDSQLFAQEEVLSSQSGPGLNQAAQESQEIQIDLVKDQAGMRKGFSEHETESPTDAL